MSAFLGHFHPAWVHLPIGILCLAVLFEWLAVRESFRPLAPAVRLMYGMGALSAILACLTGYLLAATGGYDPDTLEPHRWVGVGIAILASARYLADRSARFRDWPARRQAIPAMALFVLVAVGGHLGGSLTHGSGYLLAEAPDWLRRAFGEAEAAVPPRRVADVQEAGVYPDLVAGILQEKCTGCHGLQKQKGGLRLDAEDRILRGGESGAVLKAGDPGNSELFRRVVLPLSDEDHMPPKEKPQLTPAETALLEWWIRNGHDFRRKARELPQTEPIRQMLATFAVGGGPTAPASDVPDAEVEAASETTLQSLRSLGVVVMPVDPSRPYLRVGFQNITRPADSILTLLAGIREQVIWLDLQWTDLGDAAAPNLSSFPNLRRLNLSHTRVSDAMLASLSQQQDLQYLNLTGTGVTSAGIRSLAPLPKLGRVYLFGSGVRSEEVPALAKLLPGTVFDTGGYRLPVLAGDTSELQAPPKKN
jgi:uncharacterized membrane protein/mono/diheme cytochrome c family protein